MLQLSLHSLAPYKTAGHLLTLQQGALRLPFPLLQALAGPDNSTGLTV